MTCWVGLRAYMENWWLWNSLSLSLYFQQQVGSQVYFRLYFGAVILSGFSVNLLFHAFLNGTDYHRCIPIASLILPFPEFWYRLYIAFIFIERAFWEAECALLKPKGRPFSLQNETYDTKTPGEKTSSKVNAFRQKRAHKNKARHCICSINLPPENLPAFITSFFFGTLRMAQATIDEGGCTVAACCLLLWPAAVALFWFSWQPATQSLTMSPESVEQ